MTSDGNGDYTFAWLDFQHEQFLKRSISLDEGAAINRVLAGYSSYDLDGNATIQSAEIAFTQNYQEGEDALSFIIPEPVMALDQKISASFDIQTGVLILTGKASHYSYDKLIRSITYVNTASEPAQLNRVLSVQLDDGQELNNLSNLIEVPITFYTYENEAPEITDSTIDAENSEVTIGILGATDGDGDELTYELVSGPAQGNLILNANGTYLYNHEGL